MSLTVQEVYDGIVDYFTTHRAFGFDEKAQECMYRAPDGRKCAVGCLIPDKLYQGEFDDAEYFEYIGDKHSDSRALAITAQELHDRAAIEGNDVDFFLAKLKDVALDYYDVEV